MRRASLIVLAILILDQAFKFWVKTHMYLYEEIRIFDWFLIHFTENNGMAFGYEFGGSAGKTFLSIFRIIASLAIGWYLVSLVKKKAHSGLITCFALIFAGAIGNILDSAFYGIIFSGNEHGISKLFPPEGGYSGFLHGRVVDMLYFPLIDTTIFGHQIQFFRPVFNIADSSITVGVLLFILFQKRFTAHAAIEPAPAIMTEASPVTETTPNVGNENV